MRSNRAFIGHHRIYRRIIGLPLVPSRIDSDMRVLLFLGCIVTSIATQAPTYAAQVSPSKTPTATAVPTTSPSPSAVRHPVGKRDWWLALSRDEKLKVVEGAIDGLLNGWWRAFTDYDTKVTVIIVETDIKTTGAKTWLAVDKRLGKASSDVKRSAPMFSKKLGFYIDGIDNFYETYPHAANVTFGEVLQCLSDKPWKSCADVAAMFS